MHHFYAYLFKMKHIMRWGLMRNTEQENIKEHSLDVAIVAHGLATIANTYFDMEVDADRVLALGVFHEAGEIITGDMPTPVKYFNPQISKAYKEVEREATEKLLHMLPAELETVYRPLLTHEAGAEAELYPFVKAADKLCAYIKCAQELRTGNKEFEKAHERIKAEVDAFDEPWAKYFVEHFLPSYTLTLDELNA